jgi:glyoxylase-like metal-dependent hydrolase (beta-lactamase superfamily II)
MTEHQWQWTLLRAGSFRLDGGGMFGVVPKPLWSKLVPSDDDNRIDLQCNCLLLDDGSSKVLIETGFGGKWSDKERGFYDMERRTVVDALIEIGVDPGAIDHVILSHLHFDHAAGLTHVDESGGDAVSSFPNARIITQRSEWDDAIANRSTMTRTYLRTHLDPIAGQLEPVDGEAEVLPGIDVWPVPGHTWGQQAIRFDDGDGTVAFIGDVMPTAAHVGLAFNMGYDMLPYENMLTKRKVLEQAAGEGWRLALDHEPGDAVVRVERDAERPDRFTLEPASPTG